MVSDFIKLQTVSPAHNVLAAHPKASSTMNMKSKIILCLVAVMAQSHASRVFGSMTVFTKVSSFRISQRDRDFEGSFYGFLPLRSLCQPTFLGVVMKPKIPLAIFGVCRNT
jgi:hypothetical protein